MGQGVEVRCAAGERPRFTGSGPPKIAPVERILSCFVLPRLEGERTLNLAAALPSVDCPECGAKLPPALDTPMAGLIANYFFSASSCAFCQYGLDNKNYTLQHIPVERLQ